MVGVVVAMVVSLGGAAAVLAGLARRNAPDDGWRAILHSGFRSFRSKELTLLDEPDVDDGATGGVTDIFSIAEPGDEPAYAEGVPIREVLGRARHINRR